MNMFISGMLKMVNGLMEHWMRNQAGKYRFPANVEVFQDIPYLDDGKDCHEMDIYRPKQAANPLPVIVNFHGGGMVLCTRKANRTFCAELAKRGFLVFCMDYPLVPQTDIPGILQDVNQGLAYVNGVLETLGGDRRRVYLVGDSAGAFISIYEAAAQKNPELARAIPVNPASLPIQALGLISGMFYTTRADSTGFFLRKDFYGKHWRRHPMAKFYRPDRASIAGTLPPCFLVTSKSDNLHSYTKKFCRGLKKNGKSYRLLDHSLFRNLQHDFVIVKPGHPASQNAIDGMTDFLLSHRAP